jgi:hypothetical protein
MKARHEGPASREVADRHFFETVVRLHRAGEGAPYTGLKPAGLDVGPVIPVAEHGLQVWAHGVYLAVTAEPHGERVRSDEVHAHRH